MDNLQNALQTSAEVAMQPRPSSKAIVRVLAAVGLAIVSAWPALAADAYARIPVDVPNALAGDDSFEAFLGELRDATGRRDLDALRGHVSDGFFWDRDLGGGHDPNAPAFDNFVAAFMLDDAKLAPAYKGAGWRRFADKLGARSFASPPYGQAASAFCGPAPLPSAVEARMEAVDADAWPFGWGYVEGTGVRVRATPGLGAAIVDSLSAEAVKVTDWAAGRDDRDEPAWVAVATPSGRQGYVSAGLVESPLADRICFSRNDAGSWTIAGYVGGGD